YVLLKRIMYGDPVAGWASTISIITFMGGLILFCLGIIGQYIAKIYIEVKNKIAFFIFSYIFFM
ncbi:MAG: hypothetical protein II032_00380, partial [Treponema sp.]|nr:hypothetical protein [Treponema sp.]